MIRDVVLCKECVFYHNYQTRGMYCTRVVGGEYPRKEDDFCSDGKWKDDPSHPFADDVMMGD